MCVKYKKYFFFKIFNFIDIKDVHLKFFFVRITLISPQRFEFIADD